jgi:methylase of polypeptide subunit release factors
MSVPDNRLDETFQVFQERLGSYTGLGVDELFCSNSPAGVGAALRSFTVVCGNTPLAIFGLTEPTLSPQSTGLIAYLARRAKARRAPFLALSNQRQTILLHTPHQDQEKPEPLKTYPTLHLIAPGGEARLSPPEKIALAQLADQLAADLVQLHRVGKLELVIPDSEFFVNRLTHAVEILKPAVKKALQTKLGMDVQYAREMEAWATPQGIPADLRSPEFAEAVVRQAIYRLLGKIIFYQSLRRAVPSLPEMDVSGLSTAQVLLRLNECFAQAHKIDYHAVFREDIVDRLPFPEAASAELRSLVSDLNTRDFAHLPQDVVGAVFERLIPPEDRHALGQFFTRETLVDLIVGFCVRHPEDRVLDPTCGTGTFLIRAYDRLRTALGVHDHNRLLGQLWGVDIAPFPAELATINLFRQQVGLPGNFPRILNEDFFEIIPGGVYRFPPLKAEADIPAGENGMVNEPIPLFDAVVGNFPYISADRIEQREKHYLEKINRRLASEWLQEYPDGFTFPNKTDERQHRLARQQGLDIAPYLEKAKPIISTYADLYVYLFWHAAAFLKPGGRMGIVTSNAWLDVGYGYALQRFFLDHFKIVAVLESRCEPWFDQAAVNTVVTILERCDFQQERDAHPARFVKIKRRLDELAPWDIHLDALNRWIGIGKLVQRIEAVWQASEDPINPHTWEDDDFRMRSVRQGALRSQLEEQEQTVKGGVYLRAPQVYFDFSRRSDIELALLREISPPSFGSKTRINDFFHLDQATIQRWGIDEEYCLPLIKSPSETDTILIKPNELNLKVFVCRKSKEELIKNNQIGTLRYIEWGEQQEYKSGVQRSMKWSDGPWVKNRKPGWYALPESETHLSRLFFTQAYGDRHIQRYCPIALVADARLYFLSPPVEIVELVSAVLNSSIAAFFAELAGRVTMGDGVLELKVEDARDYLYIPDVRKFDQSSREAILAAFQPLLERPIGNVFEEITKPDRQALDRVVLRAMGLDPNEWLPRIYDGLTTLVRERVELGKMRSQTRKSKPQKAARRVADEVLDDLLPEGPQRFPDDFWSAEARVGDFWEIELPDSRLELEYKGHMMGKEELGASDGSVIQLANRFEARYVLFAQANGQRLVRLPMKPVEVSRTVNGYIQYLRDLRQRLYETYYRRTLNRAAAERFVEETWQKYSLPDPEG